MNARLRILIISNYYPPLELGGWPQLTRDVVDELRVRGHEIQVVTSRHGVERIDQPERNISRILHLESPDIEHYHPFYSLVYPYWVSQNNRYLKDAVANFNPDVIFIHGLWNMSKSIAVYAEKFWPEKVVYYIANTWPTDLDAHRSYWNAPPSRSWLNLPKRITGQITQKTLLVSVGREKPRFERVICVSEFIRHYLAEQVGIPYENSTVIHNGIDVNVFAPAMMSKRENGVLRLLYAGGLWEHKGVPTAIEAMGVLVNQKGIHDVHLTLVGSGHPSYVGKLEEVIKDHKIDKYVSFGDRVSREQMPVLLREYDVLIFPSTGPEALARMVQEAMASELLVIGSTTGGTPEILHDGVNGLSFEAGDHQMLAEKIALVVEKPDMLEKLAVAGRNTVKERFTLQGMVDQLENYFWAL
jgi:glycogen(starch) synthase